MNYEKMWRELKRELASMVNTCIESKAYMITPFYKTILESMQEKEREQMLQKVANALEEDA